MLVLDSNQPIPIGAAKALNAVGVIRYVGVGGPKGINQGEMQSYLHNGLGVGFVFENQANDWQGGLNAGVAFGAEAYKSMKSLNVPMDGDIAIYVTFDEDITVNPTVLAYLKGWKMAIGSAYEIGIYGPVALLNEISNHYLWSAAGWQGGPNPAILRQGASVNVGGIACDMNEVIASNWGQFQLVNNLPKGKDVDDSFICPNPGLGGGDFLCSWSTRIAIGIPNTTVEEVLIAQGAKRYTLDQATFAYFKKGNWTNV